MLGFIKKDLLLIKGNLKTILIILGIFLLTGLEKSTNITFFVSLIAIMTFLSSFSYDELNHWNTYATTLPNGRKNIVKAKYIATLLLLFLTISIISILLLTIHFLNQTISIESIIESISMSLIGISVVEIIMYPFIFKFGIEKARIYLFVGIFTIGLVLGYIIDWFNKRGINLHSFSTFMDQYGILLIPVIVIIGLFTSYKISERIYLKKEF